MKSRKRNGRIRNWFLLPKGSLGRGRSYSRIASVSAGVVVLIVAGVVIERQLTSRVLQTNSDQSQAQLIAFTSSRGAVPASSRATSAQCSPSQLSSDFWITLPGASQGLLYSGFTVTNAGLAACTLPTQLSNAVLNNSQGQAVSEPGFTATNSISSVTSSSTLASASAGSPVPEFTNMELATNGGVSTVAFGDLGSPVQVQQMTLNPGGQAVVVVASFFDINALQTDCLASPNDGSLAASFANGTLDVAIPILAASSGGPENSTGSAFYECGTSEVSPFVSWAQAAEIVGGPAVPQGPNGPVPGVDNSILALAP